MGLVLELTYSFGALDGGLKFYTQDGVMGVGLNDNAVEGGGIFEGLLKSAL